MKTKTYLCLSFVLFALTATNNAFSASYATKCDGKSVTELVTEKKSLLKLGSERNDVVAIYVSDSDYNGRGGDDVICVYAKNVRVSGGPGNDRIFGMNSSYSYEFNGSTGDDYLEGNNKADILDGGYGDDEIYGKSGDDYISGGNGSDYIEGGSGNDTIYGGNKSDSRFDGDFKGNDDKNYRLNRGDDYIYGGSGNDDIFGGMYNEDYIKGGSGDDFISAGLYGYDMVDGQGDNDIILGAEYAEGGDGNDVLDCNSWFHCEQMSEVTLKGGAGNDYIRCPGSYIFPSTCILEGSSGDDWLIVGTANNIITGGSGNDKIHSRGLNSRALDSDTVVLNVDAGSGEDTCEKPSNELFRAGWIWKCDNTNTYYDNHFGGASDRLTDDFPEYHEDERSEPLSGTPPWN